MSEFLRIAKRYEPRIRNGLIKAWNSIRNKQSLRQIEEALRTGGVDAVMRILDDTPKMISAGIRNELDDAIRDSGRAAISVVPKSAIIEETFRFSTTNTLSVEAIRNYELNLIQQVSSETIQAVRNGVHADIISGRNPIDTARNFRENIGLTQRQERAVRNYQRALEELDTAALDRRLRDRRFDGKVSRAIQDGRPLNKKDVDRLTKRYRERYIKYRAEVIARTESLRAVSMGQQEAMNQALQSGAIDGTSLRKYWVTARDERVRNSHSLIPDLNPDGVPVDGSFTTPLGPLRYPRDPMGSAANTIQCRCAVVYRMKKE